LNRWAAIARFGGIGDNLVAGSPFRALKRLGYMTEMITSEPNHIVFHNNPYIDKLSVHDTKRDFPQDSLENAKFFLSRSREYDLFAHLSHSMEGIHAFFPIQTQYYWPVEYRRKLGGGSYLETAHDIVGVAHDFGPLYFPTDEELEYARQTKRKVGERFICWVLSGSRIDKVYPYTALVITRILKELKVPVVMIGAGEKEFSMAKAVDEHVQIQNTGNAGLHLALTATLSETGGEHNWPLRRTLAMAFVSDLVVSPDTGPAWAVAMEPVPKIILHSHASVENICKHWRNTTSLHADVNKVPCWPCHRLHDSPDTCVPNKENNGAACISDISVESLFEAVKARLAEPQSNVVQFRATGSSDQ
jgi:ADP-heptose:LPS heptosyltransferase